MARPQAKILLQREVDLRHGIQVIEGSELWIVVYKDQPINLRKTVATVQGIQNKYFRNGFTSAAPAKNLADRFNRWFNTTDFKEKRVI